MDGGEKSAWVGGSVQPAEDLREPNGLFVERRTNVQKEEMRGCLGRLSQMSNNNAEGEG